MRDKTGAQTGILRADLTDQSNLGQVERRLKADPDISLLTNKAGAAGGGGSETPEIEKIEHLIARRTSAGSSSASRMANALKNFDG